MGGGGATAPQRVMENEPASTGVRQPWQDRLRDVVLFAGSVRETRAGQSFGGLVLDLPLPDAETVLGAWSRHTSELASAIGRSDLRLRVLVNRGWTAASPLPKRDGIDIRIEPEPEEFRGTGGMLRDLADEYADDDWLLTVNASQVLVEPLERLVASLSSCDADVAILAGQDNTPCGVQLVRAGCLRSISDKGFVDFKEQALPAMVKSHAKIRVVRCDRTPTISIRTLDEYISTLRTLKSRDLGTDPVSLAFREDWSPTFRLVDPSARVTPGATVHDSVVMKDASIGPGAIIVRSLIGQGATVSSGELVIDRVVLGGQSKARPSAGAATP